MLKYWNAEIRRPNTKQQDGPQITQMDADKG
jgi:hypothetical protein